MRSNRNLYYLQHGGKLLMLTADTLLHTVSPMLHPLLHPPAPTPHCCTAEHMQMFNSSRSPSVFSPFSLPHVCRAPALHPSSPSRPPSLLSPPSLCITLQCYTALLCSPHIQHAVSWQTEESKRETHTHTHTGSASMTTSRSHW